MKFLNEFFSQRCFGVLNDHVNATEMVRRFNHIIHIEDFIFHADGIGFKNISGLIVGQTAALDVVGIVCQINLCFMVNSTGVFARLLLFQNIQQGNWFLFSLVGTLRFLCIFGNVPGLAGKERTNHTPLGAVISNAAF